MHISLLRPLKSTAKEPVWFHLTQHFLNIYEHPPLPLIYAAEFTFKYLTVLSCFLSAFQVFLSSLAFSCDFLLLWVLLLLEASLSLLFLLLNPM